MKQCVCVYLVCVAYVYGAVYRENIKTDIVNGKLVNYCERGNIRVFPVTVFQDYKGCLDCSCRKDGLTCQTMAGAGRIIVPDSSQCTSKLRKCKNHWVMRTNENKECPPNLIPKDISMVG